MVTVQGVGHSVEIFVSPQTGPNAAVHGTVAGQECTRLYRRRIAKEDCPRMAYSFGTAEPKCIRTLAALVGSKSAPGIGTWTQLTSVSSGNDGG
jgi:hypothetical protein